MVKFLQIEGGDNEQHKCKLCYKTFLRKFDLSTHLLNHTSKRHSLSIRKLADTGSSAQAETNLDGSFDVPFSKQSEILNQSTDHQSDVADGEKVFIYFVGKCNVLNCLSVFRQDEVSVRGVSENFSI